MSEAHIDRATGGSPDEIDETVRFIALLRKYKGRLPATLRDGTHSRSLEKAFRDVEVFADTGRPPKFR